MSLKKAEPTGEYLDARAFGELLDLSRESVYRAVARGDLQAVRVGRAIRLPRKQLDALLAGSDGHEAQQAHRATNRGGPGGLQ